VSKLVLEKVVETEFEKLILLVPVIVPVIVILGEIDGEKLEETEPVFVTEAVIVELAETVAVLEILILGELETLVEIEAVPEELRLILRVGVLLTVILPVGVFEILILMVGVIVRLPVAVTDSLTVIDAVPVLLSV